MLLPPSCMCIYMHVYILLWYLLCKQGKMSTHWIARDVRASAIYSNLLILFKIGSVYLGHLPSLILSCFVFKTLGVPKAFVTSSLQLLYWEPGKKNAFFKNERIAWVSEILSWSDFFFLPLPCQINMIACFTFYAKEFLIFKGNFQRDVLVQPRRLIF